MVGQKPQNQQKFSPSKFLGYTVFCIYYIIPDINYYNVGTYHSI